MAALRSEYQERLEEESEYRCTSCERPLADAMVQAITAYRRGEKWQDVSNLRDGSGDTGLHDASSPRIPSNLTLDEEALYTHDRLAEIFNVGKDALRKRLDRYRKHNLNGWKDNEDRRPREAKYLYKLKDVRGIITELQASSQRPAK
jgi:hypothetical protein